VAVVLPAHNERGSPVVAEHLEYLRVSLRLTLMVPADHEAVAWLGTKDRPARSHGRSLFERAATGIGVAR
jgi:hypothetical protein